jgi:hypothetical protein
VTSSLSRVSASVGQDERCVLYFAEVATIPVSKWTQRYRTILSLATNPLRNVRRHATKRVAVVSSSLSSSFFISWPAVYAPSRHATPDTNYAPFKFKCADKLDDAICLRDALFDDDNATEKVDKGVLKEVFAGEFDAVSAMDGLCERGGVDVKFVQRNDILLVVYGGCLAWSNIFGRTSATGAVLVGRLGS